MRDVVYDPWHWTLWTYRELKDVERLDGIAAESARIRTAFLTHYAMCDAQKLMDEQSDFRERAGLNISREDARAMAEKTFADYSAMMAAREARGLSND